MIRWLGLCFILGTALALSCKAGCCFTYSIAALGCIMAACWAKKQTLKNLLIFCGVFLSALAFVRNYDYLTADHLRWLRLPADKKQVQFGGVVLTQPVIRNNRSEFIVAVCELRTTKFRQKCRGKLLVYVRAKTSLQVGQDVCLSGKLAGTSSYLRKKKIFKILCVPSPACIVSGRTHKRFALQILSLQIKDRIEAKLQSRLCGLSAGIMSAMLLGDKQHIPAVIYQSMVKTGTVHILVVSGFNVGIVAGMVVFLLKLLRVPRQARFYCALPFLAVYCMMTGASSPVLRATIMAVLFLFAWLVKRDPQAYNNLILSALIIVLIDPHQLFDIGFQLSFASVWAIIFFYPCLHRLIVPTGLKMGLVRFILDNGLVSLSAWIGTAGLIGYYFKTVSLIAVIANMIIPWLAGMITLAGTGLVVTESICPWASYSFVSICELLIALLLRLNMFFYHIPHAYCYLSQSY